VDDGRGDCRSNVWLLLPLVVVVGLFKVKRLCRSACGCDIVFYQSHLRLALSTAIFFWRCLFSLVNAAVFS
jgi:hypothetical protein